MDTRTLELAGLNESQIKTVLRLAEAEKEKKEAAAKEVDPHPKNFNEMVRMAKSVSLDKRGGDPKLDPTVLLKMPDGTEVYITADENGRSIGWCYDHEAGGDAP